VLHAHVHALELELEERDAIAVREVAAPADAAREDRDVGQAADYEIERLREL
jgi:hypothetical protein